MRDQVVSNHTYTDVNGRSFLAIYTRVSVRTGHEFLYSITRQKTTFYYEHGL